jgi:hypothetical protein
VELQGCICRLRYFSWKKISKAIFLIFRTI